MTRLFATGHEVLALLLDSSAWLAAGGLIGMLHFLTLRRTALMLATGSSPFLGLALQLIRFAITAGALTIIARHGAMPLLAVTLGILASRATVLRAIAAPAKPYESVVAGLVPATPKFEAQRKTIGVAGISPATTDGKVVEYDSRSCLGAPQ